jgi:hypothetical protein
MTQKQTTNSLPKTISSGMDVWSFFNFLHNVDGVAFHPEQDFNEYINSKTGKPTYTPEEEKKRNDLMGLCRKVCATLGIDIFTIGMEAIRENLGMDISKYRESCSDVAVCTLTEEYIDENTGEVLGYCKSKFYEIDKEDSIWIHVKLRGDNGCFIYPKWEFDKLFRYAEDWEAEGFKENLWDSL